ncbi:hypothetical protein AWC38_SpisGene14977 [Stylophora pistillata]|uniref:Uncharacterized protein n=1 Tax=Stylophora pistillata TaxID=50429 RepID=A0A2B4RWH7_STYPI|nr:hypothetical protein AWC38_SpisGene14977 [Stylophora pistillata]
MYKTERTTQTADTPLQPRAGEMAAIGMHVKSHQRGVLESGGNEICTAIGIQRMAVEPALLVAVLTDPSAALTSTEAAGFAITNRVVEKSSDNFRAWLLFVARETRRASILLQELNVTDTESLNAVCLILMVVATCYIIKLYHMVRNMQAPGNQRAVMEPTRMNHGQSVSGIAREPTARRRDMERPEQHGNTTPGGVTRRKRHPQEHDERFP